MFAFQYRLMRISAFLYTGIILSLLYIVSVTGSGCAQIGMPTGGPRDSIAPRLVSSSPAMNSVSFKGNKITLSFNEYIDLKDLQKNLLVSPNQKNNPTVEFKLRTVTIKLKDSLLPNTTYSINFGDAIVDNNEGNPLKNFTYVFSTGKQIDSLRLSGRVILAETGGTDSSIIAMLYRNTADNAVQKKQPDYIARTDGKGVFNFANLPAGNFKLYALRDGDGGKTYNSKVELFAFTDQVTVGADNKPVTLYAYAEEKEKPKAVATGKQPADKKLRYTSSVTGQAQDLLKPFEISVPRGIKKFDVAGISLVDSNYKAVGTAPVLDSSRKKINWQVKWEPDMKYYAIIKTTALTDSGDNVLAKADTIRFMTKKEADYGRVVLRFSNLDLSKNPVLLFVQGDEVKFSYPVTAAEWSNKLFTPGEYDLRILYDNNQNGKWDPGNYSKKLQPEKVTALPQKLGIRADWDNERDIQL